MEITKQNTIGEIIQKHPALAEIMLKYGLHCIGCGVKYFETVEQGCKAHGMSDETINKLVEELNLTIKKK